MNIEIRDKKYMGSNWVFGGQILESHPIAFPRDGGEAVGPLFYWASATTDESAHIDIHPHQGVEIISVVLEGSLIHYDTHSKVKTHLEKGDIQYTYAGSGMYHSETVSSNGKLFQIWFDPDYKNNLVDNPEYKHIHNKNLTYKQEDGYLHKYVIGDKGQQILRTKGVSIDCYKSTNDFTLNFKKEQSYFVYILSGSVKVNNNILNDDECFIVSQSDKYEFNLKSEEIELFIISVPTNPTYITLDKLLKVSRG